MSSSPLTKAPFVTDRDPRTTLATADLADQALEGLVRAKLYREVEPRQCAVAAAAVRGRPDETAEQLDQVVFGEAFDVLDDQGAWAWGRARRDGYVGWVETSALAAPVLAPTHRVSAVRTYAYAAPSKTAAAPVLLTLNALVTAEVRKGAFVKVARAGWIAERHLAPLDDFERDPVAVAERYLGAPYQWGGRESLGLDGSALVQQALYACGRACPRDTEAQARETGAPLEPGEHLRRGDLVFWPGHVALMVDPDRIIHANSHHMAVAVEPLAEAVSRFRDAGSGEPSAFRRL
jgi:cell wall-associated NlpC family hydrolase